MARVWSEQQAWEYLACRWEVAPEPRPLQWWSAVVLGARISALCPAIDYLRTRRKITLFVHRAMRIRMQAHQPRAWLPGIGGIWWPPTRAGARARAAFCRKMARLARKEQSE